MWSLHTWSRQSRGASWAYTLSVGVVIGNKSAEFDLLSHVFYNLTILGILICVLSVRLFVFIRLYFVKLTCKAGRS